jgi:uncharacterized membrane protein
VEVGKQKIIDAIKAAEAETSGEIRVHLSTARSEDNIFESAKQSFASLEMHKTRDRNGIILYLNPKLHKFAIFGDEGIHVKVGQEFWDRLTVRVTTAIQREDMTAGIVIAVQEIGQALKEHFPSHGRDDVNELNNDISES